VLPRLSGTVHGISKVTSLSRRLCSPHRTSCASYLPTLSNESIASVPVLSLRSVL